MTAKKAITISDEEFISKIEMWGTLDTATALSVHERTVERHRWILEKKLGRKIVPGNRRYRPLMQSFSFPPSYQLNVSDGYVVIFSDAHYWPGHISTAHRGLLAVLKDLGKECKAIVCNGDALDGNTISRFPPMNWDHRPTLKEELEEVQARLGEIELCVPKVPKIWPIGNHDMRLEMRLASELPEFAGVMGTKLKDHFPMWEPTMSIKVNNDTMIKHRWKGGIHASLNNTKESGRNIITGHTHKLNAIPFTDLNGTRFGVESGTLCEIFAPQFAYIEDSPRNWISGFVALRFWKGKLLWPRLARVIEDGVLEFENKVYEV